MRGNVNRRVITSTDEFLDASLTGGILPILVRPGAIHAELIRAHLGHLVVDAVYCSLPLALRGETVADRVWLAAPMNRTGSGQLNGEPLTPGNFLAFGGSAEWRAQVEHPFGAAYYLSPRAHSNGQRPHLVSNRTLPVKASSVSLRSLTGAA